MSHRDFFACEETRVCKVQMKIALAHIAVCHLWGDQGDFELEMLDGIAHTYRERTALGQEADRDGEGRQEED